MTPPTPESPVGVAARERSRGGRATPAGPSLGETVVADYIRRLEDLRDAIAVAALLRCRRLHLPTAAASCASCHTAVYVAVRP